MLSDNSSLTSLQVLSLWSEGRNQCSRQWNWAQWDTFAPEQFFLDTAQLCLTALAPLQPQATLVTLLPGGTLSPLPRTHYFLTQSAVFIPRLPNLSFCLLKSMFFHHWASWIALVMPLWI